MRGGVDRVVLHGGDDIESRPFETEAQSACPGEEVDRDRASVA
jgi:gamma-glutamyl-gamma-aminobutyrate hydrolase PuuD